MPPTPRLRLLFFALSFLIGCFSRLFEIQSHHQEIRSHPFCCSRRDISENTFFAVPPPTLGSVAQSTQREHSDPSRVFDPGHDLLQKTILVSTCHLQKICKLLPQALIYLKSPMHNMQVNAAVSEQQNCSHSMLKLARDLKVGLLDCI